MMILLIALAALVTATTIVLVRTINLDGYGIRPAPRSHVDQFDPQQQW